ncbi:MAG: 4-hydroxy-tetrahydrodipicolinate reductase [Clostridiaceae bacterium]|nr:4-hydroxy-tetrahydrodipicolinate reductase [Clostridiaceae bacterium]
MTDIILVGCNGRMGKMITGIVAEDAETRIAAGVDIIGQKNDQYPVFQNIMDCDVAADVIIDFSSAQGIEERIAYAVDRQIPLVECSTGLNDSQTETLLAAGQKVAILRSANMSVGVNLLIKLVKEAAKKLAGEGFDVEIVEKHHNQKLDAPSGTALALADSINEAMDNQYEYVYDRSQVRRKREKKELGISAVRGGTIVGEHDIIFAGTDEVVTFSHQAYSRGVFAKGSVVAAKYLKGKGAGLYDMADVLL